MGVLAVIIDNSGDMVTDGRHGLGRFETANLIETLGLVSPIERAPTQSLHEYFADTCATVRAGEEGIPAQKVIRNARRALNQSTDVDGAPIDSETRELVRELLNFTVHEVNKAKAQRIDPASLNVSFFDTSQ
jgi:hypothetical protein